LVVELEDVMEDEEDPAVVIDDDEEEVEMDEELVVVDEVVEDVTIDGLKFACTVPAPSIVAVVDGDDASPNKIVGVLALQPANA